MSLVPRKALVLHEEMRKNLEDPRTVLEEIRVSPRIRMLRTNAGSYTSPETFF